MKVIERDEQRKEEDHELRMISMKKEREEREAAHQLSMHSRRVEAEMICNTKALTTKSLVIEQTRHEIDRLSHATDAESLAILKLKERLLELLHRVSGEIKFAVPANRCNQAEETKRFEQTTLDKAECVLPTRYNVVTGTAVETYPISKVVNMLYGTNLTEKQINHLGMLIAKAKQTQADCVQTQVHQIPSAESNDKFKQRAYTLHELTTPPISDVIKRFLSELKENASKKRNNEEEQQGLKRFLKSK